MCLVAYQNGSFLGLRWRRGESVLRLRLYAESQPRRSGAVPARISGLSAGGCVCRYHRLYDCMPDRDRDASFAIWYLPSVASTSASWVRFQLASVNSTSVVLDCAQTTPDWHTACSSRLFKLASVASQSLRLRIRPNCRRCVHGRQTSALSSVPEVAEDCPTSALNKAA
jgi:hypothetical protein